MASFAFFWMRIIDDAIAIKILFINLKNTKSFYQIIYFSYEMAKSNKYSIWPTDENI